MKIPNQEIPEKMFLILCGGSNVTGFGNNSISRKVAMMGDCNLWIAVEKNTITQETNQVMVFGNRERAVELAAHQAMMYAMSQKHASPIDGVDMDESGFSIFLRSGNWMSFLPDSNVLPALLKFQQTFLEMTQR